ncbi:hypothetical protein GCM10027442_10650 [Emticicia fontis]
MKNYNNLIEIVKKSNLSTKEKEELISFIQENQGLSFDNFLVKFLRLLQLADLLDKFL